MRKDISMKLTTRSTESLKSRCAHTPQGLLYASKLQPALRPCFHEKTQPDMGVHTFNPNSPEVEAGRSGAQSHPWPPRQSETRLDYVDPVERDRREKNGSDPVGQSCSPESG